MVLKIRCDENEKPLNGSLPPHVDLEVIYTEDGVKGKSLKTAEVKGGIKVQVPIFVSTGDVIRIHTETGEYLERVMK